MAVVRGICRVDSVFSSSRWVPIGQLAMDPRAVGGTRRSVGIAGVDYCCDSGRQNHDGRAWFMLDCVQCTGADAVARPDRCRRQGPDGKPSASAMETMRSSSGDFAAPSRRRASQAEKKFGFFPQRYDRMGARCSLQDQPSKEIDSLVDR